MPKPALVWDRKKRKYWCVGDQKPFRLSRERSTKLLYALVACDGAIHEVFSLDIRKGETLYNMQPHECAVLFLISLPLGAEGRFEEIIGMGFLTEPPRVFANSIASSVSS